MEVMPQMEAALAEITGMDAVTLQPGAGAHGELTGILLIRALLEKRGNPRKKILIPDSAHGTNPATAAIAGYAVENIKSSETGGVDLSALEQLVTRDAAALMVTHPNTLAVLANNYLLAPGGPGLRNATLDAILNAIYIRKGLEPYYDLPYKSPSMHEVVFSDDRQAKLGVRTGDIAKRLIDYGFHPYTVSFPMIVHGALMIEPTETEGKLEIDSFIAPMISIAQEIATHPQMITGT